jgi:hypothetical protein
MTDTIKHLPPVPLAERPEHPRYGKALGGAPYEIAGLVFWPFRTGVGTTCRATADDRATIYNSGSYGVRIDGRALPTRFRTMDTVAKALAKALKESRDP